MVSVERQIPFHLWHRIWVYDQPSGKNACGSCSFLPSAQGCLSSHLKDLSLHCPQDDSTGEILFDEVFHALSRCLGGLLRPFRVPGSCIDFQPEIYITIQAYSSIIGLQAHQVPHLLPNFVPSDLTSGSLLTKSLSCLCGLAPRVPSSANFLNHFTSHL